MSGENTALIPEPLPIRNGKNVIYYNRNLESLDIGSQNGEGRAPDIEMHDVDESDNVTENSNERDIDESDPETEGENGPREYDGGPVSTSIHMGEVIEYAYHFETDHLDVRHMFDDGLSGDESEYASEASTNYEDLDEPEVSVVWRIVKESEDESLNSNYQNTSDESFLDDSSGSSTPETEVGPALENEDREQELGASGSTEDSESAGVLSPDTQLARLSVLNAAGNLNGQGLRTRTFSEIEHAELLIRKKERARDQMMWKVRELQEAMRRIERELPVAQSELEQAERDIEHDENTATIQLETSGLSPEIYLEYKAFCESLHPEFGLREGFSIVCNQAHGGSYVGYDPEFDIFKEQVEIDYTTCNWRCEASTVRVRHQGEWFEGVEFYPIKPPQELCCGHSSWGSIFSKLYRLLLEAASNDSSAAQDMLQRLPDMNASSSGGWLFEYEFEPLLADESVISRRWRLRSSHLIG